MKKLKKYYQEELLNYFKDINLKGKESENNTILDHEAYQSILESKSEAELNKNFLLELELRHRTIKLLLENDTIPDNMFENIKFDTTEKYLNIIKNYFRLIKEFRFVKDSEIKIKHISLKKLLFNAEFKDIVIDTLNYNIKRFYPDSILNQKTMFFDAHSFGIIFDREREFELYSKIKKSIFNYIYNGNIELFESHGKNYIGSNYKNTFEYKDYINNFIEDEIFNDLSITIDYLKKIDLYHKCIGQLSEAYDTFVGRTQIITLGTDTFDYNDKNMVSIEMNFNLSIEVLQEQLKYIYKVHSSSMNDYELLFNNDKNKEFNNIQIIRELGNGTKLKSFLKNELLDLEINDRNILIENQFNVIKLFFFDAIYLGLSGNDIDKILVEKYNDLGLNENILRDKKIYYEEILKVIRNKKFLQSP
ncbi:hypothetical protein [Aliarcobacter butzleri]|uniref:hypothetical protein n=1 Tax=Aliarcobacter butzleri TaxID=28197 RepID=UPI001EDAAAF7|nr:hypothetical protein [Aliarcobacter butzleri]MCG3684227.1 hypothetical protein [Aliarcobacter butzleri]